MNDFWVSPSSFAWSWEDCRRCWWLASTAKLRQPFANPRPVVERVDRLTLDALRGLDLAAAGVPGKVVAVDRKVKAKTIELDGVLLTVGGKPDLIVELYEGGLGVYDVKLTMPKDSTTDKYRRQTAAYAYCLENPADGKPDQVRRTGLLCITPQVMTLPVMQLHVADGDGELLHRTYDVSAAPESAMVFNWLHLPQCQTHDEVLGDMDSVRETLAEMAALIKTGKAPASAETCAYCNYVRSMNKAAKLLKEQGLEAVMQQAQEEQNRGH